MTDLNKLRSEFETWFTTTDVYKRISHQIQMCGSGRHQDIFAVFQLDDWHEENYAQVSVMASWLAWQEKAKAQSVPEGYVLMPRVATETMANAFDIGMLESEHFFGELDAFKDAYTAMVKAAGDQNENS